MPLNPKPTIGLYHHSLAICQAHDPRAVEVAQLVADMISAQLPSVQVEHVGSTAVEGCAGKGIVDLMVLYPEGLLEAVKTFLEELGFQRQSTRDPFPEDRPMRLGAIEYQGQTFRLHLHVILATSPEAAELRLFRDKLRADATLRAAYIAQKQEIVAAGIIDPIDYSIAKGEFVKQALDAFSE